MKILLDTHILLWTIAQKDRLPPKAQNLIGNEQNDIFFSLVSVWEVAIKHIVKPQDMPISEEDFAKYCFESKFNLLSLEMKHIFAFKTLQRADNAPVHKDPFDRLLIAQAKTENMKFITHDKLL